ncbi:jasmonate O-methyltransferase isoform X2 [Cinnamomum micranthum f. kanehirae]|uniref:Jasmonate O-methyltransferase isoform X2 n=1 Tax=Cinnamomum micranthum f. kanehirae TaxID=337451 RepID=A0A3S3PUU8_9MAGN|nr:jasmonate O-methyltransferase isoform X2 [Cinnamomum micranthum f. kanehirae]
MKGKQVLRMNGGNGETSYAKNSQLQNTMISQNRPITEAAIVDFYRTTFSHSISIADLGCSSGPNTLMFVWEIIEAIQKEMIFNTIFKSLPEFHMKLMNVKGIDYGECFIAGVPGTFYGRLFPSKSLDFVHSSSSLHWLSRGLLEKEKVDSFNAPFYSPSPEELESVIQGEGSFVLNRLQLYEVDWYPTDSDNIIQTEITDTAEKQNSMGGNYVAKTIRAVVESMLQSHFGEGIMDDLFRRFGDIVGEYLSRKRGKYINFVISLTRIQG